jgi:5'-nucleotidase
VFVRRIVLRVLVVGAALPAPLAVLHGGQASRRAPGGVIVQLLAINDFHGNLEPPSGSNGRINSTAAGGAEYLATHLANAIAQNSNSIVVAAGDLIGASPLVSSLFHDEPTIEALNAMNLSVSAVGNHEFDQGSREILRMERGGCHPADGCHDGARFRGAVFEYLSANVIRTATRAPLFPPTAIRTVGGVKVGFIGETLKGTKQIVAAAGTRGLTFLDEASTANAQAARLKSQGVRALVLLIHEGGRQSPAAGEDTDPNGCTNLKGAIEPIVKALTTDIPVVVSAHTHAFYNCRIGEHLVTSASSYGRMMTRITLAIDRSTDRITSASATNEIVTRDVAKDPIQTRIIESYAALAAGTANQVVGSATADIVRLPNAAGESALGDVIADAQLAATSAADAGGAVVAFMNQGGIRADITASAPRPTARPGRVTYGDLYSVQPFGNMLTVFTMTGDMIKRLLEQQFDNPSPGETSILQVSKGFTYRYRATATAGSHIDASSIVIAGRRIASTDRLRVEASDFLVAGGGGFSVLGEVTDKIAGIADIDALVAYFKARSPVAPAPPSRIVRTD